MAKLTITDTRVKAFKLRDIVSEFRDSKLKGFDVRILRWTPGSYTTSRGTTRRTEAIRGLTKVRFGLCSRRLRTLHRRRRLQPTKWKDEAHNVRVLDMTNREPSPTEERAQR